MISVNINRRGKYNNAHVGTFIPINPSKYTGTSKIEYKSELERLCMMYLDKNDKILSWSYEPMAIKYFDKCKNKVRRYYIDFIAIAKVGNLKKTIWIEVKTKEETLPPKNKKNYKAMATYMTNTCKWQAAKLLAESKGYQFAILTEELLKN